jgi:hypothetical protein
MEPESVRTSTALLPALVELRCHQALVVALLSEGLARCVDVHAPTAALLRALDGELGTEDGLPRFQILEIIDNF